MDWSLYPLLAVLFVLSAFALNVVSVAKRHSNRLTGVPRLGPHPGFLGNTRASKFQQDSKRLVIEGYDRYRKTVYSLWTTGMDRAIVPHDFLPKFAKLPRDQLRLTASIRHAGEYTGMDIAEKGPLAFNIISVDLTQNISALVPPALVELKHALQEKVKTLEERDGFYTVNVHELTTFLISRTTSLASVGPELCRNERWLATAIGYTRDSVAVQRDLGRHWRATWPFVAPFLASYKRLQSRFSAAKTILGPEIERRKSSKHDQKPVDMLQFLVNRAEGPDRSLDMISRRMLFIGLASIDTTGITLANVLFELLGRPGIVRLLREEWRDVLPRDRKLDHSNLKALRITDSVMKESQRMSPMGLVTFNRQLDVPIELPDGTFLPKGTYISVPQWPVLNDPEIYPDPGTFNTHRFVELNEHEDNGSWTFASKKASWPGWGSGKFSCPGRFWASAQMKLALVALLDEFEISLPEGQSGRPKNAVRGESYLPDFAQKMRLRKRSAV